MEYFEIMQLTNNIFLHAFRPCHKEFAHLIRLKHYTISSNFFITSSTALLIFFSAFAFSCIADFLLSWSFVLCTGDHTWKAVWRTTPHGSPVHRKNLAFCEVPSNSSLFFSLLMLSMSATPFAILLQFDLARDKLSILAWPIVGAVALRAGDFYELILRHGRHYTGNMKIMQPIFSTSFVSFLVLK